MRAEQPPDPLQRLDGVVHQFPERHDQQVADRVAMQLALAPEPVLDHPFPGLPPLVVPAQRGQRHPQVTRWEHAQLAPEPPAGPAVVGHRHDRRQADSNPPESR